MKTKKAYCNCCKERTEHEIRDSNINAEGTGGYLFCVACGSSRLDTIQGFDAALM